MIDNMTDKQRRAAYNAAAEAERTALLNLRAASIQREWHEMKLKHPDAILLYRVGISTRLTVMMPMKPHRFLALSLLAERTPTVLF